MLIAMTTADAIDYVSDLDPAKVYDKPPAADGALPLKRTFKIMPGATVFKLRGLDQFTMGTIYDNASELRATEGSASYGIQTKVNQTNTEAVRHGLIGIENFADAKGNGVAFETQKVYVNGRPYQVVADKVMNTLGVRLVQELATQIKAMSEVTASEEKTSGTASSPSA